MERSLYESALALGLVAWICSLLLMRRGTATVRTFSSLTLLLLCWRHWPCRLRDLWHCLPTQVPFAAGQGLGRGLLLGMFGSLLTQWTMGRSLDADEGDTAPVGRSGVAYRGPVCSCHCVRLHSAFMDARRGRRCVDGTWRLAGSRIPCFC